MTHRLLICTLALLAALPAAADDTDPADPPKLDPTKWEQINVEDGVTVYSQEVKGTDLVAFKGVITIRQPLEKVLSVLMDNSRRTEWVDRLEVSTVLKEISSFEYVIYQHFGLPFVISDRDYVYHGKAYQDAKGRVVLEMRSCEHADAPETVGVRAELLTSRYMLTRRDEGVTRLVVEIHTDPKGMIPTWLVNQIQKSWPVKTLSGVREQAKRADVKPYALPPVSQGNPEATEEEEPEDEKPAQE